MSPTKELKHAISAFTRMNCAFSKKQVAVNLLVLLSSAFLATAGLAPVNLGTAGNFAILSETGITDVPHSAITGNIGTSPITGGAITGMGCDEVTGTIYTVDGAGPTCAVSDAPLLSTAVSDMAAAYDDAAGRTSPDFSELGAGTIGGMTLTPGLYTWSSPVILTGNLTIDAQGNADAVFILQIAQTFTVADNVTVVLSGGAQSKNIFWQIAGATTFGTGATFKGTILGKTSVVMKTGTTLDGRVLAQTAVTLQQNTIAKPTVAVANSVSSSSTTNSVSSSSTTNSVCCCPTTNSVSSSPTTNSASSSPTSAGLAPVNLGTAGSFAILSETGITDVPHSAITGNIGASPITGGAITGMGCDEVTGTIYTVDGAGPTCAVSDAPLLSTAVSDMAAAYDDAAGRTSPDFSELGAGTIGGMTLTPGLYTWSSPVILTGNLTIDAQGNADAVFILQIAQTFTVADNVTVVLSGGAQSKNIFWQIAGATTFGTGATFKGTILGKTSVVMKTGTALDGRVLAQTAVTLQQNTITKPTDAAAYSPRSSVSAMILQSAATFTGSYVASEGQLVDLTAKTITVPMSGNVQFYRIMDNVSRSITSLTILNGNVVIAYN